MGAKGKNLVILVFLFTAQVRYFVIWMAPLISQAALDVFKMSNSFWRQAPTYLVFFLSNTIVIFSFTSQVSDSLSKYTKFHAINLV